MIPRFALGLDPEYRGDHAATAVLMRVDGTRFGIVWSGTAPTLDEIRFPWWMRVLGRLGLISLVNEE